MLNAYCRANSITSKSPTPFSINATLVLFLSYMPLPWYFRHFLYTLCSESYLILLALLDKPPCPYTVHFYLDYSYYQNFIFYYQLPSWVRVPSKLSIFSLSFSKSTFKKSQALSCLDIINSHKVTFAQKTCKAISPMYSKDTELQFSPLLLLPSRKWYCWQDKRRMHYMLWLYVYSYQYSTVFKILSHALSPLILTITLEVWKGVNISRLKTVKWYTQGQANRNWNLFQDAFHYTAFLSFEQNQTSSQHQDARSSSSLFFLHLCQVYNLY